MLIHYRCRLGAAVALKAVELLRGDGMLAENAFKGDTATQRFRCVVAHIFHSSPASGQDFGAIGVDPSIGDARRQEFCAISRLVVQNYVEQRTVNL